LKDPVFMWLCYGRYKNQFSGDINKGRQMSVALHWLVFKMTFRAHSGTSQKWIAWEVCWSDVGASVLVVCKNWYREVPWNIKVLVAMWWLTIGCVLIQHCYSE